MELPTDLLLLFGLGALLPLAVTVFTKWEAPDWVKNVVNALFALLAGAVQQGIEAVQGDDPFSWSEMFTGVIVAWFASTYAYMKLWKNSPVSVALGRATENVGVNGPLGPTSKPAPPPVMVDRPVVDPALVTPPQEYLEGGQHG